MVLMTSRGVIYVKDKPTELRAYAKRLILMNPRGSKCYAHENVTEIPNKSDCALTIKKTLTNFTLPIFASLRWPKSWNCDDFTHSVIKNLNMNLKRSPRKPITKLWDRLSETHLEIACMMCQLQAWHPHDDCCSPQAQWTCQACSCLMGLHVLVLPADVASSLAEH